MAVAGCRVSTCLENPSQMRYRSGMPTFKITTRVGDVRVRAPRGADEEQIARTLDRFSSATPLERVTAAIGKLGASWARWSDREPGHAHLFGARPGQSAPRSTLTARRGRVGGAPMPEQHPSVRAMNERVDAENASHNRTVHRIGAAAASVLALGSFVAWWGRRKPKPVATR